MAQGKILFKDCKHEKFFYSLLKKCRYQDVYHAALVYCLGLSDDTRRNAENIYDFKDGYIKPECLWQGWQTSGSTKIIRLAFNLYNNGTPSVYEFDEPEDQLKECQFYTVEELFCSSYAPYFWQAVKIRYPEYCEVN